MKLDVQLGAAAVATLYRLRDEYYLEYLDTIAEADFVSLTMPVREAPWRWPRDLHPFFRQNLPEGYLLSIIREDFGRLLDGTDLSLLALVGGTGIGRVSVTPQGASADLPLQPLEIETLLSAEISATDFAALVREYARTAVSGAVPKFLEPAQLHEVPPDEPLGKSTLRIGRYIVKGSDDATPFLGFNEFYSMRVLERLKVVRVAQTRMSADGRLLAVERFDLDPQGHAAFGLEDACSLLGLPPHEKYVPSMEQVLKATSAYLPAASLRSELEHLGWQLITNYVVRNADCHAKNIALYYTGLDDVSYTPVYDVVTTQAYPRFARNPPGLSVEGRKTWTPGKSLERFFTGRLGIAPRDYAQMVERVCESAVEVGREMIAAARNDRRWHALAKQMLHAWNEGMASLRASKGSARKAELSEAIRAAGFSNPAPPERAETIGRSPLLAGRPKRKVKRAR